MAQFRSMARRLAAPRGLKVKRVGPAGIVLAWKAPRAAKPAGYLIFRDGRRIARSERRSYVDTRAKPGRHRYFVLAVDDHGRRGKHSKVVRARMPVPPPAPEPALPPPAPPAPPEPAMPVLPEAPPAPPPLMPPAPALLVEPPLLAPALLVEPACELEPAALLPPLPKPGETGESVELHPIVSERTAAGTKINGRASFTM